jgi:hypothetical protein
MKGDTIQFWGLIVQTVAFIAAGLQFLMTQRKALVAQRAEIYQRLEIESNAIFKFEAENKDIVPRFKEQLGPSRQAFAALLEAEPDDFLVARKYYENTCNLFEVSARLRNQGIVDHTVFGSWVAWYFDTLLEWGFRAVWADLRDNYTPDLRDIFDTFVERLVKEWDLPHADDKAVPRDIEKLREDFYGHVGDLFNCDEVRGWIEEARRTAPESRHPLAYN